MMTSLDALSRDLESGRTTARELIETALARIADPAGEGSRTFIAVHAETAHATADFIDGLRKRGRQPSRWAGIPFSVKDLFDEAGEVTRAGSVILADQSPASLDAPAVRRLKALGFISVGRTNMTEFAYSGVGLNAHHGEPRAAWDRATGRIPGGSSSGAAVSVADGMVPLALGTDTGGSCRIPAAFNGVVGYKSSVGRVPIDGVFPLSRTLDSVGPLARTVACCALADAMMAGDWDGAIQTREPTSLRLGILRSVVLDDLEPPVASAFEAALVRLGKAGVSFLDIGFPELADLPAINAKGGVSAAEAYAVHRDLIDRHAAHYDQRVLKRILSGKEITAAQLIDIHRQRQRLIERAGEVSAGLDGLIMPTTPNIPPPIAALEAMQDYVRINFTCLRNTFIGNFLNCCAISLPMHRQGEAPAGLMIMAPWGGDRALFATASAVEGVIGGAE
jgi:aspartyl-tRNA(Asn)/glutamyl-tRNA(Gln) amidotransferase subunit A